MQTGKILETERQKTEEIPGMQTAIYSLRHTAVNSQSSIFCNTAAAICEHRMKLLLLSHIGALHKKASCYSGVKYKIDFSKRYT